MVGAFVIDGSEVILSASHKCRAMVCPVSEISVLTGAGKGVQLIKLDKEDFLLGLKPSRGERDLMRIVTHRGAEKTISTAKYKPTKRAGQGLGDSVQWPHQQHRGGVAGSA